MINIYLAGPMVFLPDPKRFFKAAKKQGRLLGLEIVSPLDGEMANPDAHRIYAANILKIRQCDVVIANIEPFRGPSVDPGTAFEIGFAVALGKPVYAYTNDFTEYKHKVKEYFNPWKPVYPTVEDFGAIDNLMITESCVSISESLREAMEAVRRDRV